RQPLFSQGPDQRNSVISRLAGSLIQPYADGSQAGLTRSPGERRVLVENVRRLAGKEKDIQHLGVVVYVDLIAICRRGGDIVLNLTCGTDKQPPSCRAPDQRQKSVGSDIGLQALSAAIQLFPGIAQAVQR